MLLPYKELIAAFIACCFRVYQPCYKLCANVKNFIAKLTNSIANRMTTKVTNSTAIGTAMFSLLHSSTNQEHCLKSTSVIKVPLWNIGMISVVLR